VNDEEKRLAAIAEKVIPTWHEFKVIRDELAVGGVVVYSLEVTDSKGVSRWFAFPAASLRPSVTDEALIEALTKAVNAA
jgi:hypothetical protein